MISFQTICHTFLCPMLRRQESWEDSSDESYEECCEECCDATCVVKSVAKRAVNSVSQRGLKSVASVAQEECRE